MRCSQTQMKSQHAPSVAAQSRGDPPLHTALTKAQSTTCGRVTTSQPTIASVTSALSGVETQRRSHAKTSSISMLDQAEAPVRRVAEHGDDEAQQEIARHRHGHDLERLAGLVQRRPGEDEHEVGIADRRGERGVLEEADVLPASGGRITRKACGMTIVV
jgi:hypothetical protein